MEFNDLKNEILRRTKDANACKEQYRRAYQSNDYDELMQVIKENFYFAVGRNIIDPYLIETYKDQFAANQIYCNENVTNGFLLAQGDVTVIARGNVTVIAKGNVTVEAEGNVTVEAWGNTTVKVWGNATVKAQGNATVIAWGDVTVIARGNVTVEAEGNVTVEAWDNTYITSFSVVKCKLHDNAIYRIRENNTIRYVSGNINLKSE